MVNGAQSNERDGRWMVMMREGTEDNEEGIFLRIFRMDIEPIESG